jgi:hypothetical protein
MIATCITQSAMLILALGAQPGLDPGVLHGLVHPADALVCQEAGVVASGSGMKVLMLFATTLVLANPNNEFENESFRVNVVVIAHTGSAGKAGGHPMAEDLAKAGIIAMDDPQFDATVVLGVPKNKEASYTACFWPVSIPWRSVSLIPSLLG